MQGTKITLGVISFVVIFLLLMSLFSIKEGQHGIILRLGRLVIDKHTDKVQILGPGLHVKIPFIDTIRTFDTRIQTLDIKSSRIVTKEKKDVIVDYYVKWQINNLAQYFKSTGGNQFKAETLLEQQLNTFLRAQFGKRMISDVVSGGREDLSAILNSQASQQAEQLGIHVVDVRIKGIELPANTSNTVYQLMRANMQKIANRHRADGHAMAETIQSAADAKVTVLLARARSEGQMIRAAGQAKAATIYAQAFNQNKDFFILYRSLKAYKKIFSNGKNMFVLDPDNPFFSYLKLGVAKKSAK